jgi:type VI secretion system secreted protein Hcp
VSWFNWGAMSTGGGPGAGGGGAGRVEIDELSFVAPSSIASPSLFLACATGRHLPEAVLTGRRTGNKGGTRNVLVIRLKDVTVTSYNQSGGDGELPEDEASLAFAEITIESSNGTSTTSAGWDAVRGRPT